MTAESVARARAHSLGDVLRRTAARWPDKTALIDGDRVIRYRELDATVSRTAAALQGRGLRRGDRIAILSRNNWEFVVLAYATARAGMVLVPINFMLTAAEVAFILGDSEVAALVVGDTLRTTAEEALASSPRRMTITAQIGTAAPGWEDFAQWTRDTSPLREVHVDDDDPVRIMYTSGTESRPKGVLLSSRSLLAEYVSCIVDGGMSVDDVDLHTLPLYHCAQLDCFVGPDIYLGATSIILPGPDPAAIFTAIAAHRVTKFFAPPTVWISLLASPLFDRSDLSSLRKGYYGASAMPAEVLREMTRRLPDVRLWNFYGQTELSPVATILGPEDQITHPGSAGRSVLNVETAVVDDTGTALPAGEVGEIVHRSPQATLGYWRDPVATAAAFRGGWFHSGDLGVFDTEGRLRIVDRKKDLIKTGGENVASRDVEEVIYLHPEVAEVAVFAVPDAKWVEAVCAVVVPKAGAYLDEDAIQRHCGGHLARFKIPKRVVIADALPKNASGKILKRTLRESFTASGSALASTTDGVGE